ncbi:FxSxx-COOH system tetratricopeptide repeat protein [Catellatospora citrea]|uniref:MinD-like ATPase involved in chromosome partitioning or flagellar assembly n=1 Tax=Catellatospora citrea TaxID=53366 RepID=A0A8J3NXM8_9ACTN|nr:FxSxx-COOH system tetratricopeptide repeat protein [Catellatospora citrea]RKE11145.1 MinD-like ATPase involved in chromosome partitioning or flagellar assembly [Catellatospora citrea]GIF96610.1 hypothetical protein Cci01nite_17040 [Catellatospora citrea]
MTHSSPDVGIIITFYSYKGGTGRTMTLANVAWILASQGKRVLAIDWDLESPGLHRYFHPFLSDKDLRLTQGVIDLVVNYADAEFGRGNRPIAEVIDECTEIDDYVVRLDWAFREGGLIDFMPAGRQDEAYPDVISTFGWSEFYVAQAGGDYIDVLATRLRQSYDYVLIDSRTGLNDISGICTIGMPDIVVDCFTFATQSIEGAAGVARAISAQSHRRTIRVVPVPMRVEDAETAKLEASRDLSRARFADLLAHMSPEEQDRYWSSVEIPYRPLFAYEEILAPFGERPHQQGSILSACERLTSVLTGDVVSELRAVSERERRAVLGEFERIRVPTHDILISYDSVHRTWAEWVAAQLTDAELSVSLQPVDYVTGETALSELVKASEAAIRTVILLTRTYTEAPLAEPLWRALHARDRGTRARQVLAMRIDSGRLRSPFTDRNATDLFDLGEERCRERIHEVLSVSPRIPANVDPTVRRPRFPETSPPVWRLPNRTGKFVGRAAELQTLRDRLASDVTVMLPQTLYGLGGVGKTQLAVEYAHRFAADYDLVWWVPAEDLGTARRRLAELAAELGLPIGDTQPETIQRLLDALRRGEPYARWLLIFDNAEGPTDELLALLPQHGMGHVLITTRDTEWIRVHPTLYVDVLSLNDSVQLLCQGIESLSPADATDLATNLGCLPLALEQAVAWFRVSPTTVEQYLALLQQQPVEMLNQHQPPGYPRTATATWLLALEKLQERSPAALTLLQLCSFFAPDPIPGAVLSGGRFNEIMAEYDGQLRDPLMQHQLLRRISAHALVQFDVATNRIQMHRLICAIIKARIPADQHDRMLLHAQELLAASAPADPEKPDNWPAFSDLMPHVRAARMVTSRSDVVRYFLVSAMRYLSRQGDFGSCIRLAEDALADWSDDFGADDVNVLRARWNLANALYVRGDYHDARMHDEDVLTLMRTHPRIGPDHIYTYLVMRSLGRDLRIFGEYTQAKELDEQGVRWFAANLSPDDSRTLTAESNLAVSLRHLGDYFEAARLDEHIYEIRLERYGEADHQTLLSAANLGRDLRDTGDLARSETVLRRTLDTQRTHLGESNPHTLRTMTYLALTRRQLGRFAEANALIREAVSLYDTMFPPTNLELLSAHMILASTISALGDNVQAQQIAARVEAEYGQVLTDGHPLILACRNNMAVFLRKAGRAADAMRISHPVHQTFVANLGRLHPHSLVAALNLANDLYELGDHRAALTLDEQTYAAFADVLGPNHPDTFSAALNLAASLDVTGQAAERANSLRQHALEAMALLFGEDNARVTNARAGERSNCYIEPPLA